MKSDIITYIENEIIYEENEKSIVSELNKLEEYISSLSNLDYSFEMAIDIVKSSEVINNMFNYLYRKNSNELRYLYHNSEYVSVLFMAYTDINNLPLDVFLYGNGSNKNARVLTFDEVKSLIIRMHNGDENARLILYEHNIGLVKRLARYYGNKFNMEYEDLDQQGTIGLLTAIDKYDYTYGYQFSTYAVWRIKQEIRRYCESNRHMISASNDAVQTLAKIRAYRQKAFTETGIYPTDKEVAKGLGISIKRIKDLSNLLYEPISLEQKLSPEDDANEFKDMIADLTYTTEEDSINSVYYKRLNEILDKNLTPKEKDIIKGRMGFYGRIYTLEELGKKYGLTRERIRQIEDGIIKKLRRPSILAELQEKDIPTNVYNTIYLSEYFPKISIAELRYVVEKLPIDKRNIVYRKFDKNLKGCNTLSAKEEATFKNVILNEITSILIGVHIYKKNKTLHDYFPDFTKEQILEAISLLPEMQQDLIFKRFGKNLDELNCVTVQEGNSITGYIRRNLTKILVEGKEIRKVKGVFEYFEGYQKEEVLEAIKKLSLEDQELLYRRYGENLDTYNRLTVENGHYVSHVIIPRIKKVIEGRDLDSKKANNLQDWFPNYTLDELKDAVSKLPTFQRSIIYSKYGKDLTEHFVTDSQTSTTAKSVRRNIQRILDGEPIEFKKSNLSLIEIFKEYTIDEIKTAISRLSEYEQSLLYMKYGENLDDVIAMPNNINQKVLKLVNRLSNNIRKDNGSNLNASLYEIVGVDEDLVDLRVEKLSALDKDALYLYYDNDLSKPADSEIDSKIVTYVQNVVIPKLMMPLAEEYEVLEKIFNIAISIQKMNLLLPYTFNEIIIVVLKNGIVTNYKCDIDYIAKLLKKNPKDIEKALEKIRIKNFKSEEIISNTVSAYILEHVKNNKDKKVNL